MWIALFPYVFHKWIYCHNDNKLFSSLLSFLPIGVKVEFFVKDQRNPTTDSKDLGPIDQID